MRKYLAEGLGTFFLVLVMVTIHAHEQSTITAPLAIGIALSGLMLVLGSISGAHFNPAFTLGMLIAGRIGRTEAPYYILAQVLGSVLAATFGIFLLGCLGQDDFPPHRNDGICALMAEFLGTFLFALAFLRLPLRSTVAAAACGALLTSLSYALGPVSFGVFNPAAAVGLAVSGWIGWPDIWLYLVGALLAAAAAASAQSYFSQEPASD